ncbi:MAG TPA: cbb3-type cytochrome oxidase assembly protein CcoS [Polyangia bacterium]|jgi:cbb3-type cytochrome oxidase maturation protein|nr:cbb3-type cytochrome oxidase assembly protein CcoS [Polyangia bacterium]
MFVPLWLTFLATGTAMAVLALLWAIRSRQFDDQDRARYIPLLELSPAELAAPPPPRRRGARLGIAIVLASGGLALVSTLVVVLGLL